MKGAAQEHPLRSELFSAYQMEQYGRLLAANHIINEKAAPDQLLLRLADNETIISQTCDLLNSTILGKRQITPASEWLLDNWHLIEQEIRIAKKHLPKGYSRGLPRLQGGYGDGMPRVYQLALEIISHSDARIDPESLTGFISAYQETAPLKLGELWAIPIMLRLALIENLRRVAARISVGQVNRNLANIWADKMVETTENDPSTLILVIADMARSAPPMDGSFVAELARRLQGQGPALALPLTWIEQRLAEDGMTIEQMVYSEIQQQAANQVSVSNSVGSLRFLDTMNWQKFVEAMSVVEQILYNDPARAYEKMDFATRDFYRHAIEKIAKTAGCSEESIARMAVDAAMANSDDPRVGHVGFHLVDRKGRRAFERAMKVKLSIEERIRNIAGQAPLSIYLCSIVLTTILVSFILAGAASADGVALPELAFLTIVSVISASHLGVSFTNWLATLLARPHTLPRLDFSEGIPEDFRTIVVVPTLLTSISGVSDLCESLEVRYLANKDQNLHFCLLSDFADSKTETMLDDDILLDHAQSIIERLNDQYSNGLNNIFFLMHRPRVWNGSENVWMGHERKRGKLADLNALLRGPGIEYFSRIVGNTEVLKGTRYVITLDSDTQLPRDSAWQSIATMAHPLNRPFYDESKQRIVEGYGIIQPRVAASLPGNNSSLYAQLCGGEPGIDPYTRAVSDVYQDVFQEGSFIGKGIYDVDAFEHTLKNRFMKNAILSHDLLEGCYVRSGLLSDVQLYEEYPERYSADAARRHRWIRGDWQLIGFLFSSLRGPGGKRRKNTLSVLSRWKIFDNLRRSVVPLSLVAMLVCGWTLSLHPDFWTISVAAILLIPSLCATLFDLTRKSPDITLGQHLMASSYNAGRHFSHALFTLAILPYESYYSADAIFRTLWRMTVSRKNLLEWIPSSEAGRRSGTDFFPVARRMWIGPAFALSVLFLLLDQTRSAVEMTVPVLLLWSLSPVIVWRLSLPVSIKKATLQPEDKSYLRRLSRKTWAFFETFVTEHENWLPPDNMQEQPVHVVAHRTSPTNMGLTLLANMTAYDFGYVSAGQMIQRTQATLRTMERLERYRGHFYNWYDTQSLVPLNPLYVSAVDSGNLAGHLLTLRSGLMLFASNPVVNFRVFEGLYDTIGILEAEIENGAGLSRLKEQIANHRSLALMDILNSLQSVLAEAENLAGQIKDQENAGLWLRALINQCHDAIDDLFWVLPWAALSPETAWLEKSPLLNRVPDLRTLVGCEFEIGLHIANRLKEDLTPSEKDWLHQTKSLLNLAASRARERIGVLELLAIQSADMAQMDYTFLYDKNKRLLGIGYHVNDRRLDPGFYDLLASEARLGYFVAIAQGALPQESWFALSRQLRGGDGKPLLVSWSGSMFEYLMPLLVMPTYDKTLLDQTYKVAVKRQIAYGAQRNVPWGISESGYYLFDTNMNYQYHAFGVPGLGLKRDLANDLVIAPYASIMALMVDPVAACKNLQQMSAQGFEGRFGLYEAIDYTPTRIPRDKSNALVQSFMIHHQGMSFLSLSYLLLDKPMQRRFSADPLFQSALLLLHEKVPRAVSFYSDGIDTTPLELMRSSQPQGSLRVFNTASTPVPEVNLLSNGRYNVMVSNGGGSYSRWKDLAVTRWREDSTRDNWGTYCYIRDVASNTFWSTSYQPTLMVPERYEVIFSEGRAEFRRRDGDFDTMTEIVVSPEDDIELRRTRIINRSSVRKTVEVTSYAEIVLAPAAADNAHPAFSNLFVQTEILQKRHAIICTRRARAFGEQPPWMFHHMDVAGAIISDISYETDRMRFIGRGRTLQSPLAMSEVQPLSGTQGSVLDPVVAIRYLITIEPEQTAVVDIVTGAADTRVACEALVDKYQDSNLADRVFELAWTHAQVILRQLNATEADAQLYARIANAIIYPNASLRTDAGTVIKNRRGQSGLWSYAISGDLPIVLLKINSLNNISLVRQMVQAHAYWRLKGLAVDLVIWNEDNAGYRQLLQDQILGLVAAGIEAHVIDKPGGIFVRPGDQISPEDRVLIESVACVIMSDNNGTLEEQVNRPPVKTLRMPRLEPAISSRRDEYRDATLSLYSDLIFDNGTGGFTTDGREYVIRTGSGLTTPAPWSNVLANPDFGTVISERGQSYTWNQNAHEYRLSPWHNDPVGDPSGETFYLRDEETGCFWSPTPGPCVSDQPYITRHGFGYSVFEHVSNGIHSELTIYIATDASVKFSVLKIRNVSGRTRQMTATGYVEWVLGDLRHKSKMHIVTEIDPNTGAILARNAYNTEFRDHIAFFDTDDLSRTITGDRREFIGRNGTLQHPSAMDRTKLSGKVGATLDPCAAIQVPFELMDGQSRQIVFKLGIAGRRSDDASAFIRRFRGSAAAWKVLEGVHAQWADLLGAITIETPDQSVNILANGWLMYQTIACRLWARSGYYQSGGAFGFRDQLQDAMALIYSKPELLRAQLLLHAAHQFVEGDAMHWWHPPTDRGVRTKCSDDYLWLALATCRYVTATGDTDVLNEKVHYIEGRQLNADEESYYDLPTRSSEEGTLYEHCVRAITHGLRFGEHGLPLIGTCDWNDGMDKVGHHGKGESVWLAFFLYDILLKFSDLAKMYGDHDFAARCGTEATALRVNIHKNAWDGGWYRRAYFDDGSPLGSSTNTECQIDSLSQSWSVLSGAGDPERSRMGMEEVNRRLVHRDKAMIQLLDPPFDKSGMNPGYIRGYVPGVRENGGQYTHAAIWTAMAFAKMGEHDRAFELLQMINPLNHARNAEDVSLYKIEPYVIAADVYGVAPHTGRGGWSWYTGSSGWYYRLILESLLGLTLINNQLSINPCLPAIWDGFKLIYRYKNTKYHISVNRTKSDPSVSVDSIIQGSSVIVLVDDGLQHDVSVLCG
ncbi:MAG: NdvB [Micavibrio sp.]|nr:NdvB [Micavibrio sp.]